MTDGEGLFDASIGDWQARVAAVAEILRRMSRQNDPEAAQLTDAGPMRRLMHLDRTILLTRHGLDRPRFRITRSDLQRSAVEVWTHAEQIPITEGGLLAELIYEGAPQVIDELNVAGDDPAAEHLAGMGSAVAIPYYDNGEPFDMAVHLRRRPRGFSRERFPELMLISSLLARTTASLARTAAARAAEENARAAEENARAAEENARAAEQDAHEQYRIIAELSNSVMDSAMDLRHDNQVLESRVRQRTAELTQANIDAIYMLAIASEAKDQDTGAHVRRIFKLTRSIARELGLGESDAESLAYASVLHDVGKMHVPDSILKKPGPLTAEEIAIMQQHTIVGEHILADKPFFARARHIARSHHENFDGSGYPDRRAGEAIPLEARIVHIADVYDALIHPRVYKAAWKPEEAAEFIEEATGQMFDPRIAQAFRALAHRGQLNGG
jgi:HD-GYP domain-containing protein (c-di-GMP phosphodiesterase class II)